MQILADLRSKRRVLTVIWWQENPIHRYGGYWNQRPVVPVPSCWEPTECED